jgi:hypothetical protein
MSREMSDEEVAGLGRVSVINNGRDGITGILVEASGLFFQVIEGEDSVVDALYERILADERHTEMLLLNVQRNVDRRLFPAWAMKTVRLGAHDDRTDVFKLLMETAVESHRRVEQLANGIERFVWATVSAESSETLDSTKELG